MGPQRGAMNWTAITIAITCFGFWGLFLSLATKHLNALTTQLVYSSTNLVFTLLLVGVLTSLGGKTLSVTWNGFMWATAASLMGVIAGYSTVAALENAPSPGMVNAIIHTCPIITLLLTVLFLGETVSLQAGVGLALVTVGLVMIAL